MIIEDLKVIKCEGYPWSEYLTCCNHIQPYCFNNFFNDFGKGKSHDVILYDERILGFLISFLNDSLNKYN